MTNFSLQILLTTHNETFELERTLKNILACINYAKSQKTWKSIEILATLDKGHPETRKILENHKNNLSFDEVNFGDPALCRNFLIKKSTADFICFWDADDLMSLDALVQIYQIIFNHYQNPDALKNINLSEHIAVFHRDVVTFPFYEHYSFIESNDFIKANMLFKHAYTVGICLAGFLAKKIKNRLNSLNYGYEDWDFNNRLLAAGVHFKLADYIYFYRRKKNGTLNYHLKNKTIVRYSALFNQDFSNFKELIIQNEAEQNQNSKNIFFKFHKKIAVIKDWLQIQLKPFPWLFFLAKKTFLWMEKIKKDINPKTILKNFKNLEEKNKNEIEYFKKSKKFLASYQEKLYALGYQTYSYVDLAEKLLPETLVFIRLCQILKDKNVLIFSSSKSELERQKFKNQHLKNETYCWILDQSTVQNSNTIDEFFQINLYQDFFWNFPKNTQFKIILYVILSIKPKTIYNFNSEFAKQFWNMYGTILNSELKYSTIKSIDQKAEI